MNSHSKSKSRIQPVQRSVTLYEFGEKPKEPTKEYPKEYMKEYPKEYSRKVGRSRSTSRGRRHQKVTPAASTIPNCSVCQWVTHQTEHTKKAHKEALSSGRTSRTRDRSSRGAMPRSSSACHFSLSDVAQLDSSKSRRVLSPEARLTSNPRILSPEACRRMATNHQTSSPNHKTQTIRCISPDSDMQTTGCLWIKSQSKTTTYTRYSYDIDCPDNHGYAYEADVTRSPKVVKSEKIDPAKGQKLGKNDCQMLRRDAVLQQQQLRIPHHRNGYPSPQQQIRQMSKKREEYYKLIKQERHWEKLRQLDRHGKHEGCKYESHSKSESKRHHGDSQDKNPERGRGPARIIYVEDPVSNIGRYPSKKSSCLGHRESKEAPSTHCENSENPTIVITKSVKRRVTWGNELR